MGTGGCGNYARIILASNIYAGILLLNQLYYIMLDNLKLSMLASKVKLILMFK